MILPHCWGLQGLQNSFWEMHFMTNNTSDLAHGDRHGCVPPESFLFCLSSPSVYHHSKAVARWCGCHPYFEHMLDSLYTSFQLIFVVIVNQNMAWNVMMVKMFSSSLKFTSPLLSSGSRYAIHSLNNKDASMQTWLIWKWLITELRQQSFSRNPYSSSLFTMSDAVERSTKGKKAL